MDKKLIKFKNKVDASSDAFFKHLDGIFEDDVKIALNAVQENTNVYLFSGLIRNYFLGIDDHRDIDVVLQKEVDVNAIFRKWEIRRNSFGGYKIFFESGPMDLWFMKDTWAFQNSVNTLNFQIEENIPNTAFFNFSSIIFCVNRKKFYYTEHFLKFLKDRKIDYVEKANANRGLCVVNTFFYADKFNLRIEPRLLDLVRDFDRRNDFDYKEIQLKHFGKVLFNDNEIENRLSSDSKPSSVDVYR